MPPGWQRWSGVDLLPEPSPGEFREREGEEVVVGVLDWAGGLLHLSPNSPQSPLDLLEHTSQTDCPCHDPWRARSRATRPLNPPESVSVFHPCKIVCWPRVRRFTGNTGVFYLDAVLIFVEKKGKKKSHLTKYSV